MTDTAHGSGAFRPFDADSTARLQNHCATCGESPLVLIAINHPVMRRWTQEVLAAEHGCWRVIEPGPSELLVDALTRTDPRLVIVDSVDFPDCCRAALDALPPQRVIVIGPEPDVAYRTQAMAHQAGGWVSRDDIGEELGTVLRAAIGCVHGPCPPRQVAARPAAFPQPEVEP